MLTDKQERQLKLWINRRIKGCKPPRKVICSDVVKAHQRSCLMAYKEVLAAIENYKRFGGEAKTKYDEFRLHYRVVTIISHGKWEGRSISVPMTWRDAKVLQNKIVDNDPEAMAIVLRFVSAIAGQEYKGEI